MLKIGLVSVLTLLRNGVEGKVVSGPDGVVRSALEGKVESGPDAVERSGSRAGPPPGGDVWIGGDSVLRSGLESRQRTACC